jgi:hypothetical protein
MDADARSSHLRLAGAGAQPFLAPQLALYLAEQRVRHAQAAHRHSVLAGAPAARRGTSTRSHVALCEHLPVRVLVLAFRETDRTLSWSLPHSARACPRPPCRHFKIQSCSCLGSARLSNPKSCVDNDLFNKIASNNQHAHNILLQSVKVPLPLLPACCFAAAGIYL